MARESFWCVRLVCIFDGLSERELQELSRIAPMRHFKAGQMIYHIGQEAQAVYIIGGNGAGGANCELSYSHAELFKV
jgi:hypothetical protein